MPQLCGRLPREAVAHPKEYLPSSSCLLHHNQGFSARARLAILRPVPLS